MKKRFSLRSFVPLLAALLLAAECTPGLCAEPFDLFAKHNLVAWCIVPFDAAGRGPQERAQMLQRMGITRLAYDWRADHVDSFEEEILACREHGIEFFAFWDEHEAMFQLFEKHKIRPQVWKMLADPAGLTQQEKIESAVRQFLPLVERTRELGCKLGIYNHGGWAGEPQNMVAVCRALRDRTDADHVGIVYNFHHGHRHIDRFREHLQSMLPLLLCVNINGMNEGAQPKILTVGQGQHEAEMLRTLRASGYPGRIGILDHQPGVDAQRSLSANLEGLAALKKDL